MRRTPILAAFIGGAWMATGCASIYHDEVGYIPVTSTPSGATVTVGNRAYVTPVMVPALRGAGDFVLEVGKEGYQPQLVKVEDSLDGWFYSNLLMGSLGASLIGMGIDIASGKGYGFAPEMVHVDLKPLQ